MAANIRLLTEQEHAEPFSTLIMFFRASHAMAAAERAERRARSDAKRAFWRAERRARSDAKRAFWRAERHAAWLVLMDCRRAFGQRYPEREAHVERALAERRAALEPAPCAA